MRVAKLAGEAFAEHVCTPALRSNAESQVGLWRCAKPKSTYYFFYVSVTPGRVFVYGDIEGTVIQASYGKVGDIVAWIRGAHSDYLLSKVPTNYQSKRFYVGDALAYVRERWDARAIEEASADELMDGLCSGELDSAHPFCMAVCEAGLDPIDIPGCEEYAPDMFWAYHAIKWWAENVSL